MSNCFIVQYSPQAYEDLYSIYAYIAFELQVPNTAKEQVNRIRNTIHSLGILPERYKQVTWEPWISKNVHKVNVDNYVVFYRVENEIKVVTVLRIFYGGQDIQNIPH